MSLDDTVSAGGGSARNPGGADHPAGSQLLKLSAAPAAPDDQHVVWSKPLEHPIELPLVGLGERLFAVEGKAGERSQLRCLSAEKGDEVWSLPLASDAPGHFTIDRARAYLWTTNAELSAVDLDSGQRQWRLQAHVGPPPGPPPGPARFL